MARVTTWLLPAATFNGVVGEVVTPAGNPVRPTDTASVNPFRPAIETVKLQLEVPGPAVIAVAERLMLKSSAPVTVKGRFAVCVKAPDVPPTVRV